MADWLRPVFTRKTPILGQGERVGTPSFEDSFEADEMAVSKIRPASRVSSLIGFRPSTPPTPATPYIFQSIREPESAYHNPNVDQMAETLQSIMMTQPSMQSVPVQYNAVILHVLEAYYDLRQQRNADKDIIEELKVTHTKSIHEFEEMAGRWERKEQDYKNEIKRLEVYLSKTDGGMETVTMARSNSKVHGSQRASEEIGHRLNTIKGRHKSRIEQDETEKRSTTPVQSRPLIATRTSYSKDRTSRPQLSQRDSYEGYEADRGSAAFFDSSASDSTSSPYPENSIADSPIGLGIEMDRRDKRLPNIPKSTPRHDARQDTLAPPHDSEDLSRSYRPGDDRDILAKGEAREAAKRHDMDEHIRRRRHTVHQSSETLSAKRSGGTLRKSKAVYNVSDSMSKASLTPSPSPSPTPLPHRSIDQLVREDSNSSVVTAVRDSSGRNSALSSHKSGRQGRPPLTHQTSSNDAVTAAARAIAASNSGGAGATYRPQKPETNTERDEGRREMVTKDRKSPETATVTVTPASDSATSLTRR